MLFWLFSGTVAPQATVPLQEVTAFATCTLLSVAVPVSRPMKSVMVTTTGPYVPIAA